MVPLPFLVSTTVGSFLKGFVLVGVVTAVLAVGAVYVGYFMGLLTLFCESCRNCDCVWILCFQKGFVCCIRKCDA